jgi:hypothetical protein
VGVRGLFQDKSLESAIELPINYNQARRKGIGRKAGGRMRRVERVHTFVYQDKAQIISGRIFLVDFSECRS